MHPYMVTGMLQVGRLAIVVESVEQRTADPGTPANEKEVIDRFVRTARQTGFTGARLPCDTDGTDVW
jgi:hypothetical protein